MTRIMQCTCEAYPFPHRRYGGKCEGSTIPEHASEDDGALEQLLHDLEEAQGINEEQQRTR